MDLFNSLDLADKTKVSNRQYYDEDIQAKIERGDEYLFPGRRNFFSPITSYKMMKAQFYEEDGEKFSAQDVPVDRWEVDMLATREHFDSNAMWHSMRKGKHRRNYDDIVNQKSAVKDMMKEDNGDEMYLEESDAFKSIEAILHYDDQEIKPEDILDTFETIITNSDGDDFKKAEILNQLVKIDNTTQEGDYLVNQKMKPFQKEVYEMIMKRIIFLENDGKKFKSSKDELQAQLDFLRAYTKKIDGHYGNIKDELNFGNVDRGNIYDQLSNLFRINWNKPMLEEEFLKFEKTVFYFMRLNFKINGRLKVCLIPSGGGKTTLFRKYSKHVFDIDRLLLDFEDKEFLFFIFEYSRIFKRWNVLNQFWKMLIYKNWKKIGNRILLAHSYHQLPKCKGLSIMGIIPIRQDDYNVRFFKQNSESIEKEIHELKGQLIRCHVNLMFYEIYKMSKPQFVRSRNGYDWVF